MPSKTDSLREATHCLAVLASATALQAHKVRLALPETEGDKRKLLEILQAITEVLGHDILKKEGIQTSSTVAGIQKIAPITVELVVKDDYTPVGMSDVEIEKCPDCGKNRQK